MRKLWLLLPIAIGTLAFLFKDFWLPHISPFADTVKTFSSSVSGALNGLVAKLREAPYVGSFLPEAVGYGSVAAVTGCAVRYVGRKVEGKIKNKASSTLKSALGEAEQNKNAALSALEKRLNNDFSHERQRLREAFKKETYQDKVDIEALTSCVNVLKKDKEELQARIKALESEATQMRRERDLLAKTLAKKNEPPRHE